MPDFTYTARTSTGEEIAGTICATSERDALGLLGERQIFPIQVRPHKPARRFSMRLRRKIRPQVVAATLSQMSDLMQSGVPLLRTLEVLSRQSANPAMSEVMNDVRDQVAEGTTLNDAFARHGEVFNELTVSMVRAGSEGGFLEDVLTRTADFIEQQEDLKGRVVGAATYPVILAVVGFIATTVLVVFFVPKFAELFARLEERGELPFLTVALLAVSDILGRGGLFIITAMAGIGYWIHRQLQTERGHLFADRWKLKIPLAGKIYLALAVGRFCRILGTLLKNGVPILRSLQISSDSSGNRVLSCAIREAAESIATGQTLAAPLAACGLFPQTVVEMITVAEESNNLENILVDIADGIDRRTERQLDLAVRLIEPMMLVIMAGVILVIVLALLLPVFQMSQTL